MDLSKIVRGHRVELDLDPATGSEQAKTRRCVVVQDNTLNRFSPNTIIVPATAFATRSVQFQSSELSECSEKFQAKCWRR